jgi:hypothetical protein
MRGCRRSGDEDRAISRGRQRLERVAIRHTVGMDDKVEGEGGVADANENAGARYFKLKLNGDPEHDAARLTGSARNSRRCRSIQASRWMPTSNMPISRRLCATCRTPRSRRALSRSAASLLYIEQPMPPRYHAGNRRSTRSPPRLHHRLRPRFLRPRSRRLAAASGYRGISSKSCKGIYKSIHQRDPAPPNGARLEKVLESPART